MRLPVEEEPTTTRAKTRGHHDLLKSLLLQRQVGACDVLMGKTPTGISPRADVCYPHLSDWDLERPRNSGIETIHGTTSHDGKWRKKQIKAPQTKPQPRKNRNPCRLPGSYKFSRHYNPHDVPGSRCVLGLQRL